MFVISFFYLNKTLCSLSGTFFSFNKIILYFLSILVDSGNPYLIGLSLTTSCLSFRFSAR